MDVVLTDARCGGKRRPTARIRCAMYLLTCHHNICSYFKSSNDSIAVRLHRWRVVCNAQGALQRALLHYKAYWASLRSPAAGPHAGQYQPGLINAMRVRPWLRFRNPWPCAVSSFPFGCVCVCGSHVPEGAGLWMILSSLLVLGFVHASSGKGWRMEM